MHQSLFIVALFQLVAGSSSPNICSTPGCLYYANSLKNSMNTTVNPCDNFYEFTCGQWIKENPIPSDKETWGTFDIMQQVLTKKLIDMLSNNSDSLSTTEAYQKAKKMYRNCMDLEAIERNGVEVILSRLRITGGWPVMMQSNDWTPNAISLSQIHGYYDGKLGLALLYDIHPFPSPLDSSVNQLRIDVTSSTPFKDILITHERNSLKVMQYAEKIIKVVNVLTTAAGNTVDTVDVQKDVSDLIDFEQTMAKLVSARRYTKNRRICTVNDLQTWYNNISTKKNSQIEWFDLLRSLFQNIRISFTHNSAVMVRDKRLLASLVQLLDNTSVRTIVNYIQWNFIEKVLVAAPEKLRNISFELWQLVNDVKAPDERNVICTKLLGLKHAVGHQFVKHNLSPDTKIKANEIITDIADTFTHVVLETRWLKHTEQQFVHDKLSAMIRLIAYPEWYKDPANVDNYYQKCDINDTFLDNIIEAKRCENKVNLRRLVESDDQREFSLHPMEIHAGYIPYSNAILFTAAILQRPVFSRDYPLVLQYATFGSMVGHEIAHSFDPKGARYDENGNHVNWWSGETKNTFQSKANCFVKQYNNYTIYEDENMTINASGDRSKAENIADLHGLKAAYKAYENIKRPEDEDLRLPGLESYDDKQLFFLAHAAFLCSAENKAFYMNHARNDEHSIPRLRVIGTLSNMEEFSTAFNCPDAVKMNPQNKCVVWGT